MRAIAGKRVAATVVASLVALLAAAPAAAAKPSRDFPLLGKFDLLGSKGYRIQGFFFFNLLSLEARSGGVSATYYVLSKRRGGRLTARFGRLGRVALRFHPRRALGGDRCESAHFGVYRGTIAFAGESGYTEVDVTRAGGLGFIRPPRECDASASTVPFNGGGLRTHLFAIDRWPGTVAELSASRLPGEGRLRVEASLSELHDKMLVERAAVARVGGRDAFISSAPGAHPAFAFLAPPKPFAGSAVFEETGIDSSSWAGDLSAWLPGAGRVAFAGPRFASSFCRRAPGKAGCPYEPIVQRALPPLQGSGSQSQLLAEARLSWSRYLRNSASSAGSTP